MATIGRDLWLYNLQKVVVVDVTDDYRVSQPPLPTECYPVLAELWVPTFQLPNRVGDLQLVEGYLYDWHETPRSDQEAWVIGVVSLERAGLTPVARKHNPRRIEAARA